MANIIRLGSLYLCGNPVSVEDDYLSRPNWSIEIGETVPGKEISWVAVNGIFIADRCILRDISWDNLFVQCLVFGKEITIGGFHYDLRLPLVGAKEGEPNEWDSALDAVGEADSIWHWKNTHFWGQDIAEETQYRANRGCDSARKWGFCHAQLRDGRLGFRPVLDPMDMVHLDEIRIGDQLRIWGGQNIVSGRLEEISDYDVVLADIEGILDSGFSSWLGDGRIVIDRNAIAGVQAKQKEVS